MNHCDLKTFTSAKEAARSAAEAWAEALAKADHSVFATAISGGRIAGVLFGAFVTTVSRRGIDPGALHLFWADERCVPPDHPDSNYIEARKFLVEPLRLEPRQVHRIRGEIAPELAAREAEAELRKVLNSPPGTIPTLDLVLLGMGEDGHTASLFPGEAPGNIEDAALFRAVIGPKPPPQRVTMGYSLLAAAREAWVVATGAGKEQALKASLSPAARTPLGKVIQRRPKTTIFSDIAPA